MAQARPTVIHMRMAKSNEQTKRFPHFNPSVQEENEACVTLDRSNLEHLYIMKYSFNNYSRDYPHIFVHTIYLKMFTE